MRPIDVCRASVDCFVVMAGMGFDARMRDVTSPERRTRAQQIGTHAVAAIADLLAVNALFRLRVAQGVLRLADKHGPVRLEAACSKAIAVGAPATAPSKESSPRAPKPSHRQNRPVTAGP
jgi:hypothetical protein